MSELDRSELISLEGRKAQLDKAVATGLQAAIPFLAAHSAYVGREIARLSGDDVLGVFDKDKDKTRTEQSAMAMAKASYDVQLSHYASHKFGSDSKFFSFAENFKDKDFLAKFDAMPQEKRAGIADNMAEHYLGMSEEEQKKFKKEYPEAFDRMIKNANEQNVNKIMGNNEALEELKRAAESVRNEDVAMATDSQIKALEKRSALIDDSRVASEVEGDKRVADESLLDSQTNLVEVVYETAKENGLANYRDDFVKKDANLVMKEDDLFANFDIGDSAKSMQTAGVQTDIPDTAASKPTEAQLAQNSQDIEQGTRSV